ncbi:hypothetical protein CE91St25_09420 [Campylobacter ureolyticus]|uniref:hypothetical protein n=1 Tax=Campylobacter ureolyticus TaxID=827 RepID=UPI001FC8BF43|nr:hypothetical protein [Campylobacter ureolyticus]GKH60606.1 hypothetical protein CE91St25_09420 [Campylobacter ureolyticus]
MIKKIIIMFFCCFLTQIFANENCEKTDDIVNLNELFGNTCSIENSNKKSIEISNKTEANITKKSEKIAQNEGNFSKTDKNDLLD